MIDYADIAWPPAHLATARQHIDEWDVWYRGDHTKLTDAYSTLNARVRPSQLAGGLVGAISRFFWGQPQAPGQRKQRVHVPIARDIARASADLLFSEELQIDTPGLQQAAAARLLEILDANNLPAKLLEAGELQAARGGIYLRVVTDPTVSPHPIISKVTADAAIPVFRWERLQSVQFWHVVGREGAKVWRHIEEWRPGEVEHALYVGNEQRLGQRVPLTDLPATADLAVGPDSTVPTDGMCVVYIPNVLPGIESHPDLGQADFAACIDQMDALDQCLSDWLRDVHNARARILAPQSMLETAGPGRAGLLDLDRDVFVGLDMLPGESSSGLPIEVTQFAVDVERHERTFDKLVGIILRSAGYSPATFGLDDAGAAMTATEIKAREARSLSTRERKTRYWTNALEDLLDAVARTAGLGEARTTVTFPAAAQPGTLELAQTAQALRTARAASTETLVRMVQPGLDDPQVLQEVARILSEDALADPALVGTPVDQLDGQAAGVGS